MQLDTSPGGNLYVDEEDSPVVTAQASKAIAYGRDARDRELKYEFDTQAVRFTDLLAEVERVKATAGLGASSPVDAQTALLLGGPDTDTYESLVRVVSRMVTPTARPSAAGDAPRVVREVELFDDASRVHTGDGAKFFSILDTQGRPGSWPDRFVGYTSGHNSSAIWLLSAPTPLGPWTWVEKVVGAPGSGARLINSALGDHCASPSVVWNEGWALLFYHGPLASNGLEQPTFAASTTDGRAFSPVSSSAVIPTEYSNQASPYRTSTSYATVVWADGHLHAVWQGTTGMNASGSTGQYAPMPVGYGTSMDGARWVKRDPVIYATPGDQGLLAPGLIRLTDGWMVCGSQRSSDGGTTGGQIQSVGCYMGPSLDDLHRVEDIRLPGVRTQYINGPQFITWEGRMWMIGGVTRAGATTPVISAFELDWSHA